jgi:deoxyadenosine/deoxycytidine kinase
MTKPFFLAIEGPIGVGKTTLARLLQPRFKARLLLEAFEENPFLSDFYTDRARYAFQTQMFFLLSRYRQHQTVPSLTADEPLISDYTFAKDALFARLNLEGDELEMYQRLYTVLAERIVVPDLLIYLQAETNTLMARIAARDRPYEREMDRDYISRVKMAYENHFARGNVPEGRTGASGKVPLLLTIDTNNLNYVRDASALAFVEGKVRGALGIGAYQQPLPQIELTPSLVGRVRTPAAPMQMADPIPRGEAVNQFLAANEAMGRLGALLAREEEGRSDRRVSEMRTTLQRAVERVTQLADLLGVDL